MEQTKCKVCGHEISLTGVFCPQCGFEHHILPQSVSQDIMDYEENRVRTYKSRLDKIQKQLREAQDKADNMIRIADTAKKEAEEAKKKADAAKGMKPKGFLFFRDISNETVAAVYEGQNTYGCVFGDVSSPVHQEVSLQRLQPIHFSIENRGERFILHDKIGDIKSTSMQSIPAAGLSIPNNGSFIIGDKITVKLIIN